MGDWKTGGTQYLPALNAAEDQFALPRDLLARICYQESRFRADICSGAVKSTAGCVGLMQLNPRYFPDAGKDWHADIITAAHELARLHGVFKSWRLAVMSFDWGQGNVRKWQAGKATIPNETANYLSEVFFDVPVSEPGQLTA